jgi:DNA-binding transcriptional regulator YhcF (GntR family)
VQFAEGRLAAGARFPSSRALAAELGLARSTVVSSWRNSSWVHHRCCWTEASTQTHVRECHAEIKWRIERRAAPNK